MESVDRELGARIRQHEVVGCPHCDLEARWVGVGEYVSHVAACRQLLAGQLQAAVDEIVPTVEEKPQGWRWAG